MNKAQNTLLPQVISTPWWLQLLRGLLALTFGLYTVAQPALTLVVLVQFMGFYFFIEGVSLFFTALTGRSGNTKTWVILLRGLFYLLAGFSVVAHPLLATMVTSAMLGWFVGLLAVFGGITEIATGLRSEKNQSNDWHLIVLGVLSVIFGVILLSAPALYSLAMTLFVGFWSIFGGLYLVANSFKIKAGQKKLQQFKTGKLTV